jgi:hypothetical protein
MYLVVMDPAEGVNVTVVQAHLGAHAQNWYRFAPGSWVVVSNTVSAQAWLNILTPHVPPGGGQVFICRLDPTDHQGVMRGAFWQWFNAQRAQGA